MVDTYTPEQNKAIVRRLYEEAWNERELSVVEEVHATDSVHHDPSNPENLIGPEGTKARIVEVTNAFPDLQFTIEDMVAEDDKVTVYWTTSGTHEGSFAGIPATGRRCEDVPGFILHRLEAGKIVEEWAVRDTLGLLAQLGVAVGPRATEEVD